MKILMVCLGNSCRSPLAEGILRDKARQAGEAAHPLSDDFQQFDKYGQSILSKK